MKKFFTGNEYQFQIMTIVMEIWEQKMLLANNWYDYYPMLIDNGRKKIITVELLVGDLLSDDDISLFKQKCKEKFGDNCAPSSCTIQIYKNKESGRSLRYLRWREKASVWPSIPSCCGYYGLDYEWYCMKTGKTFPQDMLKPGEVICEGEIYRVITSNMELLCAIQDGVLVTFKDTEGHFVPRDWSM